jgi:hypothetical protein
MPPMSNAAGYYARKAREENDVLKKIDALARAVEELADVIDKMERAISRFG